MDEKLKKYKRGSIDWIQYRNSPERAQFIKENHNKKYYEFHNHIFKDKSCIICGTTKFLHYQHIESHDTNIPIMKMKKATEEDLQKEIKKCVPICTSCHIRFHKLTLTKEELLKIPTSVDSKE